MTPITYKCVIDGGGLLHGIELWQGSQHIVISMQQEGTHKSGYRWNEIKEFVDNLSLPEYHSPLMKTTEMFLNEMHPLPASEA